MSHTDTGSPYAIEERSWYRKRIKCEARNYVKSGRRRIKMALRRLRHEHEFDHGGVPEKYPLSYALGTV